MDLLNPTGLALLFACLFIGAIVLWLVWTLAMMMHATVPGTTLIGVVLLFTPLMPFGIVLLLTRIQVGWMVMKERSTTQLDGLRG